MGTGSANPFGEVLKAEIRGELADVMALRGCDLEVETILESWGDTMNDHQVLAALQNLKLGGLKSDDITDPVN
jgi:hypothetical protein